MHSLYTAWKYVTFHQGKTAILVACVTLIAILPLALNLLLQESEQQLRSRATSTPLVLGAKGSALDLTMNTLYFSDEVPELMTMAAAHEVAASNLATPIPMYARFLARGFPIVGTTLDYFAFRGLRVAAGRGLALLGDCVLGATVAKRLGLRPGDPLISSPETLFDLAGVYPLKMTVAGILKTSHSVDDLAVLVDLKTAWIIQGLGHGHKDVTATRDPTVILNRTDRKVIANAKLEQYTEITAANLEAFHFHGDLGTYPITAVIAVPQGHKAATILRGRYISGQSMYQIVRPADVIDSLLENIFRMKNVLDAVLVLVSLATILAIVLVFTLSLRLRQNEITTIFKLGCRRLTIARLLAAEIVMIGCASGVLCAALVLLVQRYDHDLVRMLFM